MRMFLFVLLAMGTHVAQADDAADMREMRQMMQSPEYQQQMQQAKEQMKLHGMDPAMVDRGMAIAANPKAVEAAMGMNKCMEEKLGRDGMDRMAKRGEEMGSTIKTLCAAGKEAEAERVQKDYAAEMMASDDMKKMQVCAEKYKDVMNDPAMAETKARINAMKGERGKKGACG